MHISESTLAALENNGWTVIEGRATKFFESYAIAGTISNGGRFLTVEFDATGRWLEHTDAWGKMIFEIDSREYFENPDQFAKDIESKILEFKA
jgi:YD repeat-containing protein